MTDVPITSQKTRVELANSGKVLLKHPSFSENIRKLPISIIRTTDYSKGFLRSLALRIIKVLLYIEKYAICLKDYRLQSFLSIQYVHGDLCKHLGIDSSTDHLDRYSNLFLNAYINRHVHAEYLKMI